jgi:hypothetical protein
LDNNAKNSSNKHLNPSDVLAEDMGKYYGSGKAGKMIVHQSQKDIIVHI